MLICLHIPNKQHNTAPQPTAIYTHSSSPTSFDKSNALLTDGITAVVVVISTAILPFALAYCDGIEEGLVGISLGDFEGSLVGSMVGPRDGSMLVMVCMQYRKHINYQNNNCLR